MQRLIVGGPYHARDAAQQLQLGIDPLGGGRFCDIDSAAGIVLRGIRASTARIEADAVAPVHQAGDVVVTVHVGVGIARSPAVLGNCLHADAAEGVTVLVGHGARDLATQGQGNVDAAEDGRTHDHRVVGVGCREVPVPGAVVHADVVLPLGQVGYRVGTVRARGRIAIIAHRQWLCVDAHPVQPGT